MREFDSEHSSSIDTPPSRVESMRLLGRAVTTLFFTPPHLRVYRDIRQEALATHEVIPLNPSAETLRTELTAELPSHITTAGAAMSTPEAIATSGLLMQFGNHLETIPEPLRVDYHSVQSLYSEFVRQAAGTRLSLSRQLIIAVDQCDGNLQQALVHLLITSRHYARWLDEKTIRDLPDMPLSERREAMVQWQNSLLGFKSDSDTYHDAAGDTYYAWTHAYAGFAYERLIDRTSLSTRLAGVAFRHGTPIMQTLVNNFNPRGILSDHSIAAHYGNMLADVCNELTPPRRAI